MRVLIDTSVWSLALRRRASALSPAERLLSAAVADLIADGRVLMVGPVRQELLTGIRDAAVFERLRMTLRAFPDEPLAIEDYEEAARAANRCRASGISSSNVDMLICGVALRRKVPIFTVDQDFNAYASWLPLRLYIPETTS